MKCKIWSPHRRPASYHTISASKQAMMARPRTTTKLNHSIEPSLRVPQQPRETELPVRANTIGARTLKRTAPRTFAKHAAQGNGEHSAHDGVPRYGQVGRAPLVRNCPSSSYNAGLWNNYCSSNGDASFSVGGVMHSITVQHASLTANDISSILNLICPGCGGPLGGESKEFKCQGHCRKDWRSDWDSNGLSRSRKKSINRSNSKPMAYPLP